MKKLADDVYLLAGFPPYAINVYLVGESLVDAGSRHAAGRILRELKGSSVSTHVLTHAHGDHQGSSHELCEKLQIPLWCGERDAEAVQDGRIRERMPPHPINRLTAAVFTGPAHPPPFFTPEPERNRESMRRLTGLEPSLVYFSHGPPLRDPAKLATFTRDRAARG